MKFREPKEVEDITPKFSQLESQNYIKMRRMLQKVIETVTAQGRLGPNELEPWAKELTEEIAALLNEIRR
jgi:hypothetical protein